MVMVRYQLIKNLNYAQFTRFTLLIQILVLYLFAMQRYNCAVLS